MTPVRRVSRSKPVPPIPMKPIIIARRRDRTTDQYEFVAVFTEHDPEPYVVWTREVETGELFNPQSCESSVQAEVLLDDREFCQRTFADIARG